VNPAAPDEDWLVLVELTGAPVDPGEVAAPCLADELTAPGLPDAAPAPEDLERDELVGCPLPPLVGLPVGLLVGLLDGAKGPLVEGNGPTDPELPTDAESERGAGTDPVIGDSTMSIDVRFRFSRDCVNEGTYRRQHQSRSE